MGVATAGMLADGELGRRRLHAWMLPSPSTSRCFARVFAHGWLLGTDIGFMLAGLHLNSMDRFVQSSFAALPEEGRRPACTVSGRRLFGF